MKRLARYMGVLILVIAVAGALAACSSPSDWLFSITGETEPLPQAKALLQLLFDQFRPHPQTADYVPVAHAGLNPFGVNTFLEQEADPAKRELAVRMIAEAGFHWIRQEFPWEDIEIHGKGDFEDRRHTPYRSAWEKYDHIVSLAEKYGLELIVRLDNPPAWSRAAGDAAGSLAPPDNFEDFGDFVETVVRRYKGRVHYYQIWNEPNIYPEWGERPVDPKGYVELLKIAYTRAKAVDPDVVIICGAMASTIELDYRNLNDFAFLQQMYDAGAAPYFDVLAMQGYGLWSGPTDRRLQPRVINFSRPLYIRDIMVKNGDAHKPIWISEMNWNAAPDALPEKPFGQVTPETQARYVLLAYERIQREWPWLGVANVWFFKRATDQEINQPMYYFRMVEPDFTPMPLYEALKSYTRQEPALYRGCHQEDHWALRYQGAWQTSRDERAVLGAYRWSEEAGASITFRFEGRELSLIAPRGPAFGSLRLRVDGAPAHEVTLTAPAEGFGQVVWRGSWLSPGPHTVEIEVAGGRGALDALIIRPWPAWMPWLIPVGILAVIGLAAIAYVVAGRRGVRLREGWRVRR
jgi:hypothetical protein